MEARKLNNNAHKVIVKKVIAASIERVFDAWTKPEFMNQWYCGGKGHSTATVDLRVGGRFTNEMFVENPTCKSSEECSDSKDIKSYMHEGEYLEISKPERLVFTWNSHSVQNTIVTIDLKEVADGTEVTITHALPDQEACEGHTQGWTHALSNLAALKL